jgi:hypothetical protein
MVRAISFNNLQISLYDRQISFNAGSHTVIPLLQSFTVIHGVTQGRRASLCSALAPGYNIARLWRCAI